MSRTMEFNQIWDNEMIQELRFLCDLKQEYIEALEAENKALKDFVKDSELYDSISSDKDVSTGKDVSTDKGFVEVA